MALNPHTPTRQVDAFNVGSKTTSQAIATEFIAPGDGLARVFVAWDTAATLEVTESDKAVSATTEVFALNSGAQIAAGMNGPYYFPVKEGYGYTFKPGDGTVADVQRLVVDVVNQ